MLANNQVIDVPAAGTFNFITGDNGTGKTRFLTVLAATVLNDLISSGSEYDKLVCLTGTVYEKFPRPLKKKDYKSEVYDRVYSYFGGRVNNNVFSDLSPFRVIMKCYCGFDINPSSFKMAGKLLDELGFSSIVECKFRNEKSRLQNGRSIINNEEVTVNLSEPPSQLTKMTRQGIVNDDLFLLNINFVKVSDKKTYGIRDLSSGERSFIITILSLVFSLRERTLILFDEPENSMHPKWQEKIISTIKYIVDMLSPESTVIIATHSPLVVSCVTNNNTFTLNLPGEHIWKASYYAGNNADSVLKEQFGIISPRSEEFQIMMQKCLTSFSLNEENGSFLQDMEQLFGMKISLNQDDPLYDAYETLTDFYLERKL
ncbi:TPA: ATP-binding protein [Klebsiella aerogenes]|uniref:AAA family ATPase n=1 Tax=Klebsiella aerogenes TaxID=548 RepID=UPI000A440949|nr:ATP-binding protein [Klebsiella aerogenes]HCM2991757.1 ATP-binding protein [Klebsiella aerogenes]HDU6218457.1 ATP-binding protein [Klebsiella aerogenes]